MQLKIFKGNISSSVLGTTNKMQVIYPKSLAFFTFSPLNRHRSKYSLQPKWATLSRTE